MASIKKRDNGQWRARYRDDAGKEHARHFARKIDAQRWLDEVTASVLTGAYVDPRAGRVTFAEYAAALASVHAALVESGGSLVTASVSVDFQSNEWSFSSARYLVLACLRRCPGVEIRCSIGCTSGVFDTYWLSKSCQAFSLSAIMLLAPFKRTLILNSFAALRANPTFVSDLILGNNLENSLLCGVIHVLNFLSKKNFDPN